MNEIKVIIAGSRTYKDYTTLSDIVDYIFRQYLYKKGFKQENIEIVCGKAKGADTLGETYAKSNNFQICYFPADWENYGKSAGYIRNKQMAEYASYKKGYGALIAFWDGKSKGTKHMINITKECGLKVFIYNYINNTYYTETDII